MKFFTWIINNIEHFQNLPHAFANCPSLLQLHRDPFNFVAFPFHTEVLPSLPPSRLFDIHDIHEHN